MVKDGPTPASMGNSRRTEAQKEWKVDIRAHMNSSRISLFRPASAWRTRTFISPAAFSVKVSARMLPMLVPPSSRLRYFCTRTCVFPVPAPAVTHLLVVWSNAARAWRSVSLIDLAPPR